MVSPSGTLDGLAGFRFGFFLRLRLGICDSICNATHVVAERGVHESSVFEEAGHEMIFGGLVVDRGDEQTLLASLAADRDIGEAGGDFARELRALGLVLRKKNADRRITA